jgi:hypothetical protein
MLFFYLIGGWIFLLLGVDPTGGGAWFAFLSPWPTFSVVVALPLLFRPALHYGKWLRWTALVCALFSVVVALRLADDVSRVPLALWSAACIVAAVAIGRVKGNHGDTKARRREGKE